MKSVRERDKMKTRKTEAKETLLVKHSSKLLTKNHQKGGHERDVIIKRNILPSDTGDVVVS